MMKKIKGIVKETYKVVKGSYQIAKAGGFEGYISSLRIKFDEKDEDGFIVRTDDDIVYGSGFTGACTTLLQFGGFFAEPDMVPVIFLTTDMTNYSDDVNEWVVYHEKGHYVMGHLESGYSVRNIEKEIEADLYAASKMGKDEAIKAMTIFAETLYGPSKTEMLNRISAVEDRA